MTIPKQQANRKSNKMQDGIYIWQVRVYIYINQNPSAPPT